MGRPRTLGQPILFPTWFLQMRPGPISTMLLDPDRVGVHWPRAEAGPPGPIMAVFFLNVLTPHVEPDAVISIVACVAKVPMITLQDASGLQDLLVSSIISTSAKKTILEAIDKKVVSSCSGAFCL